MTEDTPFGRPLTAEDVVRHIAAECAFISTNGEVGIRDDQLETSQKPRNFGGFVIL